MTGWTFEKKQCLLEAGKQNRDVKKMNFLNIYINVSIDIQNPAMLQL